MLPETHPLIDSITQPFAGDVEMKLSVRQILEDKFDPSHPSVQQMLERLERQNKRKCSFSAFGLLALWFLAVSLLGLAISSDIKGFIRIAETYDWEWLEDIDLAPAPRALNKQELLLLGDPEGGILEGKQKLFESDPANPAYFVEYATTYQYEYDSLPPDFLETADRIDPGNSLFNYIAALQIGNGAIEDQRSSRPRPPDRIVDGVKLRPLPVEREYTIIDHAAYIKALELFKIASEMPKFRSYVNHMVATRARLLATDNFMHYEDGYDFYYATAGSGFYSLSGYTKLLAARAEELSKNGNAEEFQRFAAQREALLEKLANHENAGLAHVWVYETISYGTIANFHAAAQRLELKEMEETYRRQRDAYITQNDFIKIKNYHNDFSTARVSSLGYNSGGSILSPVSPITIQDSHLKPMRLVEHELLGRFGILVASLILLIGALVVFLFRFLATKSILIPARQFATLLKVSDWIWIFILGIALPILLFLYISRLSPVSGRDYCCYHFQFKFPAMHHVTLVLTLLLAPAIITRWRLTRRTAAFKFGSRLDLLALPVVGVMLIYMIVAFPVIQMVRNNDLTRFGLSLPLLGWLGFVFFNGLRIFLGSARSRLMQSATAIAVIPAYPLAILALCLTLPIYIKAEREGLAEDKRIFIDPITSELGSYDYKIAAQKLKEINAIMGFE